MQWKRPKPEHLKLQELAEDEWLKRESQAAPPIESG